MFSSNRLYYPAASLFKMIEQNRTSDLETRLNEEKDINPVFSLSGIVEGETLFHAAVRLNRVDCLSILLKHKPNASDILERLAIYYGDSLTAQALTPLQVAIQKKHRACEQLLMAHLNQLLHEEKPPAYSRKTRIVT